MEVFRLRSSAQNDNESIYVCYSDDSSTQPLDPVELEIKDYREKISLLKGKQDALLLYLFGMSMKENGLLWPLWRKLCSVCQLRRRVAKEYLA